MSEEKEYERQLFLADRHKSLAKLCRQRARAYVKQTKEFLKREKMELLQAKRLDKEAKGYAEKAKMLKKRIVTPACLNQK
jgi:ABC-type uncharacterized transport system ATPase subunit